MIITILAREIPGSFVRYKIKLNGRHFTKLSLGEEKELHFLESTAEIQARQFFGKSNKLIVSDGDCIEIRLSEWNALRVLIFILFTYSLLALGIIGTSYFILSVGALTIFFGYFETFKLIKVE